MRKIRFPETLTFVLLAALPLVPAIAVYHFVSKVLPPFDLRALVALLASMFVYYCGTIIAYRLFIHIRPIPIGELAENSPAQFNYHVHVLFFLMLFYPVIRSGIVPAPLMRLLYLALGAKLGSNTYSQGIIHDPVFVRIGRDSIVGQSALIIPHVIEGRSLAHFPVTIGDDVTIGANAIILAGSRIGDGAIVAAAAVVPKNSVIGPNEVWGGVPARRLR